MMVLLPRILPRLLIVALLLLVFRMPALANEIMDQWNKLIGEGGVPKEEAGAIVFALYGAQDELIADQRRYELPDRELYLYWREHPPVDERNWEVYRKSAEQLMANSSSDWRSVGYFFRDLLRLRALKTVERQKNDLIRLVMADVNLAKSILIDFAFAKELEFIKHPEGSDYVISGAREIADRLLHQVVAYGEVDFTKRWSPIEMDAAFKRWPNQKLDRERRKLRGILRQAHVQRDPLVSDARYEKILKVRDLIKKELESSPRPR
jgi:hypothetical protein